MPGGTTSDASTNASVIMRRIEKNMKRNEFTQLNRQIQNDETRMEAIVAEIAVRQRVLNELRRTIPSMRRKQAVMAAQLQEPQS